MLPRWEDEAVQLITDTPWDAAPDRCPCDWDFVDWLVLDAETVAGAPYTRTVFHMGTGAHHYVGTRAQSVRTQARVVGFTASPEELAEYARLMIAHPEYLLRYQVLFGDIYVFDPTRWLPMLDVVTLFHLCEFTDERRNEYGGWDDDAVLMRFIERTHKGGCILFYMGSVGYSRAVPVIQRAVDRGLISSGIEFKSLRSCRVLQ